MFYHNLSISDNDLYLTSQVNGVNISIEDVLSEILDAPTEGIRSLRSE